jgi:hypothetical protein
MDAAAKEKEEGAEEAPAKKMSRQECQRRLLEYMTLGRMTVRDAARAVGISADTVNRWLRKDAAFRRELDAWRAGPTMDAATLAQSRRIIIDELARRMLFKREDQSIRDLISMHDRMTRETANVTENEHGDDDVDGEPLTPEEARKLWDEVERAEGAASQDEAG